MEKQTKCWYCGKETMVPDELGAKCTSCGATWSPPLTCTPPIVEYHRDPTNRLSTIGSPTKSAKVRRDDGELKK